MNTIGKQYGQWLSGYNWTHIATYRPHYKLNEFTTDKQMQRVFKRNEVNGLFYALERDRSLDGMKHAHIMLLSDAKLTSDHLAEMIGANPKAIGYFQEVKNPAAISHYCTKNIRNHLSAYNLFTKTPTSYYITDVK